MANVGENEKSAPAQNVTSPPASEHEHRATELPAGWMYKSLKIGPITLPWYASPEIQLLMVALVCFLCPGKI